VAGEAVSFVMLIGAAPLGVNHLPLSDHSCSDLLEPWPDTVAADFVELLVGRLPQLLVSQNEALLAAWTRDIVSHRQGPSALTRLFLCRHVFATSCER